MTKSLGTLSGVQQNAENREITPLLMVINCIAQMIHGLLKFTDTILYDSVL
jgi:hypothetical protein